MKKLTTKNIIFLIAITGIVIAIALFLIFGGEKVIEEQLSTYSTVFGAIPFPITKTSTYLKLQKVPSTSEITSINKVYAIDPENKFFPSTSLADEAATSLQMKKLASIEKPVMYTVGNNSLTYDNNTQTIEVTLGSAGSSKQKLDEKKAELIAKNKLQKIGLWPFETDYATSYKYYSIIGYNYYDGAPSDKAAMVGVTFSSKIDDIPLIQSRIASGEIEVIVNADNEIFKIIYAYRPISTEVIATYPIISPSQALSKAQAGGAEIVIPFEGQTPSSVNITDAIMAYRVEYKDQKYLQPVYVFEGTDNNDQPTTIIVPAIEDRYLINTK